MTIPNLDATGKIVVITGASKGLGRAMSLGFAAAGADVVVASRKIEACEIVADEVRALGQRALAAAMSRRRLGRMQHAHRRHHRSVWAHRRARQQRRHRAGAALVAAR